MSTFWGCDAPADARGLATATLTLTLTLRYRCRLGFPLYETRYSRSLDWGSDRQC
ncbi:MAG: hypothetical protein HWQ38_14690 [Nostoc sp. NMS7]|uniref:hypothetical protein n=1 Tax=Nostoc sp. NMS7 TaxID=2815391 RepID=UPI0025EAEF7A|nr:hypothetical protein [Nostoc sp. NMS7]MBN3947630.1 hypothetical protein [Nostoc sp. NMS7]